MGVEMSAEAIETRRAYQREYRRKNWDKINSQRKNWRAGNRDKVQQYNKEYWERRAEKAKNIRASWEDHNISPQRLDELTKIARSDGYAKIVMECALKADRKSAGHIILSVTKGLSYEHVEFHERLGRCPLGRTDFYGARRLFFHYLDCALNEMQGAK